MVESCSRPGAVGVDCEDVEVASHAADERDRVSVRRPEGEVVVAVGEVGDVGDHSPHTVRTRSSEKQVIGPVV